MTNRKLHTCFRLVPKLTFDDLEGPLCTLFQNTCIFQSPSQKFEWRYTHTISDEEWPVTLVSGNIRLWIRRGSNDSAVIENIHIQGFRTLCLWHFRKWSEHYYIALVSPLSPFYWLRNSWPWMARMAIFMLNFHYYKLRLSNYLLFDCSLGGQRRRSRSFYDTTSS